MTMEGSPCLYAHNRSSTFLLKAPGELPSLSFPWAVCGREGERAGKVIALLWMEGTQTRRKETACPGASVSTGAQLPRSSGWDLPWALLS